MFDFSLPLKLVQNKVFRYPGGRELDRFRGIKPCVDDCKPEAWVGSTTVVSESFTGTKNEGLAEILTKDDEPILLTDAIAQYPDAFLGAKHREEFGDDTALLVKLLDAQNQLPFQCHPSREYAQKRYNSPYGKEECWYIIGVRDDCEEPPYVLLGFKEGVKKEDLEKPFRAGNLKELDALCHKISVQPGEVYYVAAGVPHAIGGGCFVIEVQEPSDIMAHPFYMKERSGNEFEAFVDLNVNCFHYEGYSYDDTLKRFRIEPQTIRENENGMEEVLIGKSVTPYFSAVRVNCRGAFSPTTKGTFGIAIVTKGNGVIKTDGGEVSYQKGDEWFIPAVLENYEIIPDIETDIVISYPASARF